MPQCKNCSKQFFCNRKECTFISWIYTKSYGEVRKIKSNQEEIVTLQKDNAR